MRKLYQKKLYKNNSAALCNALPLCGSDGDSRGLLGSLSSGLREVGNDPAQATKAFEAAFGVAPRGTAPLAALHAGCALAQSGRCADTARALREADRMRAAKQWRPDGEQGEQLDGALLRCNVARAKGEEDDSIREPI